MDGYYVPQAPGSQSPNTAAAQAQAQAAAAAQAVVAQNAAT